MKKIFTAILTLIMIISCSSYAFAEGAQVVVDCQDLSGTNKVTLNGEGTYKIPEDLEGHESADILSVTGTGQVDVIVNKSVKKPVGKPSDYAVSAEAGASVTVTGDVDGGDGFISGGINAISGSTVNISGNITSKGLGSGVPGIKAAEGSTVEVRGDVSGNTGVDASGDGTVIKVGGDVTAKDENGNAVVISSNNPMVMIEGTVTGDIKASSTDGNILIGKLEGDIINLNLDNVHYLIGTENGSNNIITVTGDIISTKTIDGVKNKGYHYTSTADSTALSGQSFVIKSTDSSKKITINKTYAGVDIVNNADGTVTLTLKDDFKGGIQALELILEDIARKVSGGGSTRTLYTGTWNNPVTNGKWTLNADGTWSYSTAYKFTETWGCIADSNKAGSPAWYYFDRNGIMLTGWQLLNWNGTKKWYYFSQTKDANEGKCQLGGITPDGYVLNPDGSWKEN